MNLNNIIYKLLETPQRLFSPENSHPNTTSCKNLPGSNVRAPAIKSAPTYTPIIECI